MVGRYDKVGQAAPTKSATLEIIKIPYVLKGSPSQAVVCENGPYPLKWDSSLPSVPKQLKRFRSFTSQLKAQEL